MQEAFVVGDEVDVDEEDVERNDESGFEMLPSVLPLRLRTSCEHAAHADTSRPRGNTIKSFNHEFFVFFFKFCGIEKE